MFCAFRNFITDRTSQSVEAGIRASIFNRCMMLLWSWEVLLVHASCIVINLSCTIVFKKNGPPTNYKFQIHNNAHARLLEAPVHKMTQWNHINMLYFEIKYGIEWNEGFIIVASMPLKIEITIKMIYTNLLKRGTKFIETRKTRKLSNKRAWSTSRCSVGCISMGLRN